MSLRDRVDPELIGAIYRNIAAFGPGGLNGIADLDRRRAAVIELRAERGVAAASGVTFADQSIDPGNGERDLVVRVYRVPGWQAGGPPEPVVYFVRGGGLVLGDLDSSDPVAIMICLRAGCTVVAVDYRRAPEDPYPAGFDDTFRGLQWLAANAGDLGLDPDRIAVYGLSGGGALAAGSVLKTRDCGGPGIAFQMLICPMLDDRNDTPSAREITNLCIWDRAGNIEAWNWYLQGKAGSASIATYAAPGRETNFAYLPPTYIETSELDLFRDEDIAYAQGLLAAGIPTELHVFPRAYHGFDVMNPDAAVTKRAVATRFAALRHALGIADAD